MTTPELSVFLQEWFCGCGSPEDAAEALLWLLELHPLYDHREELKEFAPDDGVEYLLLYMLDRMDLTEHGGTVGGGWLTDKGKAVRDALSREQADGFAALFEQRCVHGYLVSDDGHECAQVESEAGNTADAQPPTSPDGAR